MMGIVIEKACTDRFSMNFFRFGHGMKTFVMLPGISVQSVMKLAGMISNMYKIFNDDFTVYVFDRRNELPEKYTVAEMAEDTTETMKILGLKDICLFGASQGGMMAQVIAAEYPELVSKLALSSTSALVDEKQYSVLERWISLAEKKETVSLYSDFGKSIYPPDTFEKVRGMLAFAAANTNDAELERFITLAKASKNFDISDRLADIKCPVLVTGSLDDAVLGKEAIYHLSDILAKTPKFEMHIYENYGHACFDTAPDHKQILFDFFMH